MDYGGSNVMAFFIFERYFSAHNKENFTIIPHLRLILPWKSDLAVDLLQRCDHLIVQSEPYSALLQVEVVEF